MKPEILSAANFLVHLIRLAKKGISEAHLTQFHKNIIKVLTRRYRDHWIPDKPFKGSGFRCIRCNQKLDPVIGEAGESVGLSNKLLQQVLPAELTLWIDPMQVSYRIGNNGSTYTIYEYQEETTEWNPCLSKSRSIAFSQSNSSQSTIKDPNRDYLPLNKKMASIEQLASYIYK